MSLRPSTANPFHEGLAAARGNARPGLALIAIAIAIIVGYSFVPAVAGVFDHIAEWKLTYGFAFAICSTALFGGVLPILVQQMRSSTRSKRAWVALPFLTMFWAYKGYEIDLLYRLQAEMFGDNAEGRTILAKIAFDQLVYSTLWGVPTVLIAYTWSESGYSWLRTRQHLGSQWYRRRVLPMLIANWGVWIPTVAVIYCLKLPLQLPVQNIILCMWTIMVMFMVQRPSPPMSTDPIATPAAEAANV